MALDPATGKFTCIGSPGDWRGSPTARDLPDGGAGPFASPGIGPTKGGTRCPAPAAHVVEELLPALDKARHTPTTSQKVAGAETPTAPEMLPHVEVHDLAVEERPQVLDFRPAEIQRPDGRRAGWTSGERHDRRLVHGSSSR